MQLPFGLVLSRRRVVVASDMVKVGRLEQLHPTAGGDCLTASITATQNPGLRRVVATRMEGVAATDTAQTAQRTAQCAVFANRLNEVGTATGLKATMRPQQGTERPLIQADCTDQRPAGQVPKSSTQCVHGDLPGGRAASGLDWRLAASFRWRRTAEARIDWPI